MDAPAESLAGQLWTANRHNDVLRQALSAAEAECAEWRERGLIDDADDYSDVPSVLANDATRARLGLGRIGEAASS